MKKMIFLAMLAVVTINIHVVDAQELKVKTEFISHPKSNKPKYQPVYISQVMPEKLTDIDMFDKAESFKKIKVYYSEEDVKIFAIVTDGYGIAGMSYLYLKIGDCWEKILIPVNGLYYAVKEVCGIGGDDSNVWIKAFSFDEDAEKTYNYNFKTKEFKLLSSVKTE